MRRAVALSLPLLACLAFAGSARAQDEEPAYAPASEAHREGRWSMQFEVDDNFQLKSFNGAGLAVTRNSSPSGAWRLGVTILGDTEDGEFSSSSSIDSVTSSSSRDLPETHVFNVGAELLRLRRFNPDRRIDLELAVGPSVGFFHQENTQFVNLGGAGYATQDVRSSSQVYGLVGRLGVEVFVARSLSLHAHYGAFFGYRHTSQLTDSHESYNDGTQREVRTDQTVNEWLLSNSGVTLGVSAYL